ncbi:uncharacterized protein METZ01_LOCUS15481 [marine metagenome]|uniref:Uncharacterized protein n=1 Tax=marine metagenome TaxID=408172 RepID=A0A381P8C8_9ZZZZ
MVFSESLILLMFLGLLIFRSIKYNGRCIQQSNNKN